MPISVYHFITAKWHYVPTMIYIASCLCLNIVLYILNIHSRTRYSSIQNSAEIPQEMEVHDGTLK
jgi:hypothetical protein